MEKLGQFLGRMSDPTTGAFIKGPCGEEIEFYLVICSRKITDISFYTEGCGAILSCGYAVCREAVGTSIHHALQLSAGYIIKKLTNLEEEDYHCAVLAVMTFYKAIGEYLLKK